MRLKDLKAMESPEDYKRPVLVDVCVSVTMHKTFRVPIRVYEEEYLGKDEDGDPIIERTVENDVLADAVQSNFVMPYEKFPDWSLDEFEVVEE